MGREKRVDRKCGGPVQPKEKQGECMKGLSGAVNGCFVFYSFIIDRDLTVTLSLDSA